MNSNNQHSKADEGEKGHLLLHTEKISVYFRSDIYIMHVFPVSASGYRGWSWHKNYVLASDGFASIARYTSHSTIRPGHFSTCKTTLSQQD